MKFEERDSCLECGTQLYGRSGKKFCCLSCKNKYHNRIQQMLARQRSDIIATLDNNKAILDGLLRDGVTSIGLEELVDAGFVPGAVTGHARTKEGHNEYSCFDIRFCQSSCKIFKIRRVLPSISPQSSRPQGPTRRR